MNRPIIHLFVLFVVLFAGLIGFTSRWTVFEAKGLRDNAYNRRPLLQEARIKRGAIKASDGTVLARSVARDDMFTRKYPLGELFGHPVGYSYTQIGRSGLELFYNDALVGRQNGLVNVWQSIFGHERKGRDIITTLNAKGQRVARAALNGRRGAVVALDVTTGAVLTMVTSPSYDPSKIADQGVLGQLSQDKNSPLVNRATQAAFPPGSTFKALTAAAAIDSGKYTPDSVVSGKNGKTISGVPLNNSGGANFGDITLTNALTHSVNTVWAEVGVKLGLPTMAKYMQRFGFYSLPPLDYPSQQMVSSGERAPSGKLYNPQSGEIDVGRMAIGQHKLLATPLQMATVAQTIANGGVRLNPFLMQRIVDSDGRVVKQNGPHTAQRAISQASAQKLTQMMKNVVREGTGTAAALQGVEVAGKTGTAEINPGQRINDLWFIGFTPKVAVAVVLERVQGGQGGTVAAPVAKQVLEALGQK